MAGTFQLKKKTWMENRFEQSVIEHGRQSVDARKIEASGDYDPESWIDQQISP